MNNLNTEASSTRVIFLDNLRYFFVLCVVLLHAGNAYTGLTAWWPVSEKNTSIVVDWLDLFFDAFTMPLLFYIAGYFALPSIQKGIGPFLKGKFLRLGVPWIICILTICPIVPLIYHYTRNDFTITMSYMDLWMIIMKDFAQFHVGIINSMDELMRNNHFYQRYMWFLSALLALFFIFSIIYKVKKRWFEITGPLSIGRRPILSTLKLLAVIGFLSSFCSALAMFVFRISNPSAWFTLGNIVQFQIIRLPLFILYFGMGIITYRNKWIERGVFPGHVATWTISFIMLLIAYCYFATAFLSGALKSKLIDGLIFLVIFNLFTMSVLGFFSSLAIRYWDRPTKIDRDLASNSYNIYLAHYIFVLVFQLVLYGVPGIPVLLKFVIVSVFSILCAYLASRFLIKPFPRLTVVLLFVMLAAMFVIIKL